MNKQKKKNMTDYINANLWQLWSLIIVASIVLEMFSGSFFIICFAVGGLAALVSTLLGGIYVQTAVFAIVSAIAIFLVRPFALRYIHQGTEPVPSNADAIIGRKAKVSQDIPANGYGRVAIDGDDWKATASTDIKKGDTVTVVTRESIILTVEPA